MFTDKELIAIKFALNNTKLMTRSRIENEAVDPRIMCYLKEQLCEFEELIEKVRKM